MGPSWLHFKLNLMQYFDFLACSRLMCFRVFVFVSWLAKASKTQSLKASNLQVASAGDAKRKQSARPPWGEGVLDCSQPWADHPKIPPYRGTRIPPRQAPSRLFFHHFFRLETFHPKSHPGPPQGTPQGPPNHANSDFLLKMSSPGPYFHRFSGRSLFFTLFESIFGPFFIEKS